MTGRIRPFLTAILCCLLPLGCAASGSGSAVPPLSVVPLVTTLDEGVADSQVIPIRLGDEDAWLALDTGAPFSFLYADPDGPEFVEHAGTIEIGSERWRLPGYGDEAIGVEMFQGKRIVGILGLDFFLEVPAEIDYPGGRLVRHLDGALPAGDEALPAIPLRELGSGRALVEVELDGTGFTLMFDTGAHDTILIGAAGKDDDELTQVQTVDGQVWDVYLGKAILSLPGEDPRAVPVLRAADLPYIAPELREIQAHGLFGLTSLGWRRVIFDFRAGLLRLGPLGKAVRRPQSSRVDPAGAQESTFE